MAKKEGRGGQDFQRSSNSTLSSTGFLMHALKSRMSRLLFCLMSRQMIICVCIIVIDAFDDHLMIS